MGVVATQDRTLIKVRRSQLNDAIDALARATNSARSAQRFSDITNTNVVFTRNVVMVA